MSTFTELKTGAEIEFSTNNWPAFCGGKIITGFVFNSEAKALTESSFSAFALNFEKCLRATSLVDIPEGYSLTDYDGNACCVPACTKILFTDAVNGERGDPEVPSIYKIGINMSDEVYIDEPSRNPNSGREVVLFHFNR